MYRAMISAAAVAMIGLAVAAQTAAPGLDPPRETPPTEIPEVPADHDPMDREPDPAAGTPAATGATQPKDDGDAQTTCQVRRADTQTGFVVVCDQRG